ncbi:MAG: sortase, partial [Candidatus Levyibacteriota bacterium]
MPKKRKHKRPQFLTLRTKVLFLIGIFLVIIPGIFYTNEGIQLAFFTPKVPLIQKKLPPPISITIDNISLNLPIQEEAIYHGGWQIAGNAISHLNTSARPGENGPIILYAHNTNNRFGPIRWLQIGEKITIKTTDGKTHEYLIKKTEDVFPSQINLLTEVKGETLI